MDIGGTDLSIPSTLPRAEQLAAAVARLRAIWPQLFMIDPDTHAEHTIIDTVPADCRELIVYESAAIEAEWERLGCVESLYNTCVLLFPGEGQIGVTLDRDDDASGRWLLDALTRSQRADESAAAKPAAVAE